MNYPVKLILFLSILGTGGMVALLVVAGLKIRNLQAVFTLIISIFAFFISIFMERNKNSFREWIGNKLGADKMEEMVQKSIKHSKYMKYLSAFMFLLSIMLIISYPMITGVFLRINNIIGIITIIIGIVLFFAFDFLKKDYFPEIFKKKWFNNIFKLSCVLIIIIGLVMMLWLKL